MILFNDNHKGNGVMIMQIIESNYFGLRFFKNDVFLHLLENILPFVKRQKNTFETERLIASYVSKNGTKVYTFKA